MLSRINDKSEQLLELVCQQQQPYRLMLAPCRGQPLQMFDDAARGAAQRCRQPVDRFLLPKKLNDTTAAALGGLDKGGG